MVIRTGHIQKKEEIYANVFSLKLYCRKVLTAILSKQAVSENQISSFTSIFEKFEL